MKILAIETSCDETGLALIEAQGTKKREIKVLANLVRSQIEKHRPYGGVVPNIAKREHKKVLPLLWRKLTKTYHLKPKTLGLIAVTQGPGLSPCLWAGINFAEELANELNVPLVGVNHLKGHIYTVFPDEEKIKYPILALIVSGGHTELVLAKKPGKYQILGRTRDDAAGEAFDKVARLLGLAYPGGPEIAKIAKGGNAKKFDLPRPMISSKDFDFSFAGLKTAVVYLVRGFDGKTRQKPLKLTRRNKSDMAASFQKAVVDVLVKKTILAARKTRPKTIILGGGVAANQLLRKELRRRISKSLPGIKLVLPPVKLTGDNALMIALAAWYEQKLLKPKKKMEALPNLRIDEK